MRLALRLTAALPLLWAFGACSSSPATAPSTSQAGDATARAGGGLLLGAYEATFALEAEGPVGSVEPLASQSRAGQKVGDLFALEVAEYFAGNPCGDCFKVSGLGLTAEGDLAVDLRMRHPFSSTATRSDLDVFDPRALILTDQAAITFAALDPVLGGRYGDIPAQPSLEAGLVLNADGYTARYDWIAEDPAVMGSPRGYDGTLNPYVDFFTEDNPDPVGVGEPIPNRRLAMASGADVKRLVISRQALAARGNQLSALLLIEVSYGAAAERRIAAPAPGSRTNPVYFLPAFNRKEPLVLQVTPPAPYVAGISEVGTVEVAICDWQAGLEGVGLENFAQPPDYTGTGQVPVTSTLTKVLLSAPALEMGVKTVTTFPDGTGTLADPWRVSFSVLNVLQPAPGTYYGLVAAQDSYHGTQTLPGLPAGGAPTAVGDFQTFQLVPFVVEPGSSNTPPTAVLKARKQGTTTWTTAPATLNVAVGDTVEFTLEGSMDPEELWGNPAAHFDLDGDPGTGDGGFETTRPAITDIATATFTAVGSRTVRGKAVDHLGLASGVESMTVSAAGAPTCYALTDLGVLFPKRMIEHSADTVNGKIYIFSGYSPDPPNRPTDGHVYDPSTNSFSVTTPGMQNGREAAEVLAIGTKVYVVGGAGMFVGLCTSYVNTTDIYDTITGTWAPGATLNPNLWRCAGVAHNGRIWLPGGFRQWDEFSCGSYVNSVNTTTIYNPTTNAWSNLNDFGVPVPAFAERRWGHGAAVLNGKLTIFPGYYETSGGAQGTVRTVNEYDLSQAGATWMVKDQAPGFRDLYELEVVNNRAYLIGGESAGTSYSQVWQYDPTKPSGQQWTTLNTACGGSPLPTLYSYAAAVYNGEIYLFGGQNSFGVYTRACYKLTLG